MILTSLYRALLTLLAVEGTLLAQGNALTITLPGGAQMEFVWLAPGTFVMGTTEDQEQLLRDKGLLLPYYSDWEQPAHQVTISKGFYLGKYEITQGQWESVMGTWDWSWQGDAQANPNNPAVFSWDEAQEFAGKVNDAAGEALYRLPTEAEWEYACRAGTSTLWSFGDDETRLGDYAWYAGNAWDVGEQYAHAVGTKLPNPWGLFDMHGNVLEWCQDVFSESYYSSSPGVDPPGPTSGSYTMVQVWTPPGVDPPAPTMLFHHVYRGGWSPGGPSWTRAAFRDGGGPAHHSNHNGARLLRMEPKMPEPTPVIPKSWGQAKRQVFH